MRGVPRRGRPPEGRGGAGAVGAAAPAVEGDLFVERDGAWVAADRAGPGRLFGMEGGGRARSGSVRVASLGGALLRAGPELVAGRVLLEADAPAVVRTPLAEIRLAAHSACVAELQPFQEETMAFSRMKIAAPAMLAVTVLAGGVVVANDEGEEEAGRDERIVVEPGTAPALERLEREVRDVHRMLEEVHRRMEELERARAEVQQRVLPEADRIRAELVRMGPLAAPVTLTGGEATLNDVVGAIAEQTGVRFECVGGTQAVLLESRVRVAVEREPAGAVLARLLAQHGLVWRHAGRTVQILKREDSRGGHWPRDDSREVLLDRARRGDAEARRVLLEEHALMRDRMREIEAILSRKPPEAGRFGMDREEHETLSRCLWAPAETARATPLRREIEAAFDQLRALPRDTGPSEALRRKLEELRLESYARLTHARDRKDDRAVEEWEATFVSLADTIEALKRQFPDAGPAPAHEEEEEEDDER